MATDKNILKGWFKNLLKPTQEQFWAWMDSYWHKDEKIPAKMIDGLENLVTGGDSTFAGDFVVQQPNDPNSMNGYQVKEGDSVADFLVKVFRKASAAVYTAPTADITGASTSGYELGQTVFVTVNGQFNQNDGGAATAHRMFKNGAKVADAATYSENIKMSSAPVSFYYEADYAKGAVKNDTLGNPSPAGQIQAGMVRSGSMSYVGYLRRFWGAAAAGVANYRGLAQSALDTTNVFALDTGTQYKDFYIIIPTGRSLVSVVDLDALNANITARFEQVGVQVADAGGTLQNYKKYQMSADVPYGANHRLQITIS